MSAGPQEAIAGPVVTRVSAPVQSRRLLLEAGALLLAAGVFLVSVLPNLANHPTITDDEMWIMSSAYKLASQGVFGSDMFEGFYNADRHYFFNMPGHHFVMAGAFKLFGAGILQARLVGVVYGLATLLLAYLLGRRLAGTAGGVLTVVLLLFVRFNMGFDTGLPLQELSASMRYDLAPVPFMLAGTLVLLGGTSLARAAAAGALFGVATLMQFYGVFMFPIALAFLWLERMERRQRLQFCGALLAAALVVGLPYGVYILAHFQDFRGQVATVDQRNDFLRPGFYLNSLRREPERFLRPLGFKEIPRAEDFRVTQPRFLSLQEMVQRRPSAKIAVLAGLPASIALFGARLRLGPSREARMMLLCLLGLPLQYTLFESLKLYIYWIPVIPFLCAGMAAFSLQLLRLWRIDRPHALAAAATCLVLLLFLAEGGVARLNGIRVAQKATDYELLSQRLRQYVPEGSRVVGSTSLWWALRNTDYRSYFLFFYLTHPNAREYRTTIDAYLRDSGAEYLVINRLAAGELAQHLVPKDFADYDAYMRTHARLVMALHGDLLRSSYGFIDIWKLE